MAFEYDAVPYDIRPDLPESYRQVWQMLAQPGNWWNAQDRVAIAAESRNAPSCPLCQQRKSALSPYSVAGEHQTTTNLPTTAVDAIHRLTTDPSRLTQSWLQDAADSGLSDANYVELLGIVVAVISIDAFHRALGLPLETLPDPQPGAPSDYRPPGAQDLGAWVPTINPADLTASESDLYGGMDRTANVISAMSLVPDSVRMLNILSFTQYLPMTEVGAMTPCTNRALTRPQMELLAGRVSSLSDCFY